MAKTSKNTPNLKKSPSPRITKALANKFLARVPERHVFYLNSGSILRDIGELKEALAIMSDSTFSYHSNEIKKDFCNWIRDVVGDVQLARNLEDVTSREQAMKIVEERCKLLSSKAVGSR
jgi:hypothetical protein